jgi:hypothetical protein
VKTIRNMTAPAREKLGRLLADFLKADGAALQDIERRVEVETLAGKLTIHYDQKNYGAILCRFEDPDTAKAVLHGSERIYPGGPQRLNPHSGKWNFHFGACIAEEAFEQFEREFKKVRLP